MAQNGISTYEPASGRRDLKLAAAALKRQQLGSTGSAGATGATGIMGSTGATGATGATGVWIQIAATGVNSFGSPSYRPYNQYASPGASGIHEPFTLDPKWLTGIGTSAQIKP